MKGEGLRDTALGAVLTGKKLTWELCWVSECWQLGEQDFGKRVGDSGSQKELKQKRLEVAYEHLGT